MPNPVDATLLPAVDALGWSPLGTTTSGRPIVARRFGGVGPPLVVVAGVHGDEPSSVATALTLASSLTAAAPSRPVWLVPALNPDGLATGRKNNARDVDLNRNFPARSFSLVHEPRYFPGPAPLSEPESRALTDLLAREPPAGVVAVHAPLACVNYDGPAAAWAEVVAAACGWPARGDIGYPTPGSLGSWLGRDQGLPVLTIELPPGDYDGFHAAADRALGVAVASAPVDRPEKG